MFFVQTTRKLNDNQELPADTQQEYMIMQDI